MTDYKTAPLLHMVLNVDTKPDVGPWWGYPIKGLVRGPLTYVPLEAVAEAFVEGARQCKYTVDICDWAVEWLKLQKWLASPEPKTDRARLREAIKSLGFGIFHEDGVAGGAYQLAVRDVLALLDDKETP